ncbi:MAG: tetratricopeptide repeat protein [Pseudomonadota bacterium]
MKRLRKLLCATVVASSLCQPLAAQTVDEDRAEELDTLFAQLALEDQLGWEQIEERIKRLWSKSGSASADYLLKRGRDALEAESYTEAVEHFTALTDHAPDFAEGWNGRATAFYLMEEYGLAVQDVLRTLMLNPRHFEALSGLGLMMERMERPDAALAAFVEARKLHPHHEIINDAIDRLERRVGQSSL